MKKTCGISLLFALMAHPSWGLAPPNRAESTRRAALEVFWKATASIAVSNSLPAPSQAAEVNVDSYLKSGGVPMPMGVSGQGGKMRPETGVVFRDGTEVSRDARNGDVLAEILLKSKGSSENLPVLTTFSSPWPLGKQL